MKTRVSEHLYYKLPRIYRAEDAKVKGAHPLPLKRFLQVMGVGMDFMEGKIDGLMNLFDIDNCPPEFLDKIVETLGFKFPYALPENEQRRFVKVLPLLYKTKGTTKSFEYLAREIFGTQSTIRAYTSSKPEEKGQIFVDVVVDGEQLNLGRKEEYFKRFAESVRPINTKLCTFLKLFYQDVYTFRERVGDTATDYIDCTERFNDMYRRIYTVNGERQSPDIPGSLLYGEGHISPFITNKSHLYNNQSIELMDRIKEEFLPLVISFENADEDIFTHKSISDKVSEDKQIVVLDTMEDLNSDKLCVVFRDTGSSDVLNVEIDEDLYKRDSLIVEEKTTLVQLRGDIDRYNRDKIRDSRIPFEINLSNLNDTAVGLSSSYESIIKLENEDESKIKAKDTYSSTAISYADDEDYSTNVDYSVETEIIRVREPSLLGIGCKLNSSFYTNDFEPKRNLSF